MSWHFGHQRSHMRAALPALSLLSGISAFARSFWFEAIETLILLTLEFRIKGRETTTRTMKTYLKFACVYCGQHLECERGLAGWQTLCPACGHRIVIPSWGNIKSPCEL